MRPKRKGDEPTERFTKILKNLVTQLIPTPFVAYAVNVEAPKKLDNFVELGPFDWDILFPA